MVLNPWQQIGRMSCQHFNFVCLHILARADISMQIILAWTLTVMQGNLIPDAWLLATESFARQAYRHFQPGELSILGQSGTNLN